MKILYNYKFIVLPLILASLQSCFVAKDYEQPEIIQEENFRTDNLPQDSITMAEVSWRDMFTDPILQEHIDEGLKNNIDIKLEKNFGKYWWTGPIVGHIILNEKINKINMKRFCRNQFRIDKIYII